MSELIDSIIESREIAAHALAKSLTELEGKSEIQLAEKVLTEIKTHKEIFPEGWYNPPPKGVAVIFDKKPFIRLKYDSLRKPDFWPNEELKFDKETVAMIFFSPVHKMTNMIGDIGFTIYFGNDPEIKEHIKNSYKSIMEIAKYAEVGMTFSQLCTFAENLIKGKFKITRWITKNTVPTLMNIGHTIPGSYQKIDFGNSFKETIETITHGRTFIKEIEEFKIPETCAFTVESRLEDLSKPNLPSVYFHFIICFDNGKKTILENFNEIFRVAGMEYMKSQA